MKRIILALIPVIFLLMSACTANQDNTAALDKNSSVASGTSSVKAATSAEKEFFENTEEFITSAQDNATEAASILWNPEFLKNVDYKTVYDKYIKDGGDKTNVSAFAAYLTQYAPVQDNWKEMFEKNLMDSYSKKPERYEDLGGGLYTVYVENEGAVVPYVTVNSRTGWFHG